MIRHLMKATALCGAAATLIALAPQPAAADEKLNIVFTHHSSASNPFWQAVKKGFEDACAKIQANCQMIFTQTEGSIEQQVANQQAALARNPDALITTLVDNNAFLGNLKEAKKKGVIVIASNVDATEGPELEYRQAFVGQNFVPGGRNAGAANERALPQGRADPRPRRHQLARRELVGAARQGNHAGPRRVQEGERRAHDRHRQDWTSAPTGRRVTDRVGAYISAHPDTTAYIETGLWHSNVARMLKDRGIPPGKILLGGFDLAAQVIEQMKAGYIQVEIDQQPYEQGFLPVMQVYLEKKVGLMPANIDSGEAVFTPEQADRVDVARQAGPALTPSSDRDQPAIASGDRRRPPDSDAAPAAMKNLVRIYLEKPELAGIVLLVLLTAVFEVRSGEAFLSPDNLRGILGFLPEVGLVSIGVTILMICGEFDLSVGSTFALTPMATSLMIIAGAPTPIAILLGLAVAGAVGFVNGFITLTFAIPSFITTLGMLFIVRSLTVVISGGFPPLLPDELNTSAFTQFVGPGGTLPHLLHLVSRYCGRGGRDDGRTNLGNWIRATGGNLDAATAMGVPTRRVKLFCFVLCAMMAGFGGIIQVFRLHSPLPSIGDGLELQAVAAAVIGGTALTGGVGTVLGAIVGALLIRVIDNGLVMSQVDANWFKFAIGVLTIFAVVSNTWLRRTARRMKVTV